ncbi:ergothioneine biosynthesis protein EgtC [Mycobacterium sp. AMU20-3851]|uniref:ergothioneine biosynthesis protein EgtC n=1 Tax=Mycobacterium sp. AMU20-3851 TaxID=3122055 RepID=UPI003753F006
MCRHLGWLGAPVTVSSLVLDPPSGLLVQSYSPRRQKHGTINADGWGVGFFDTWALERSDSGEKADGPRRWRSDKPLWGDASFASVAPALRSGCVVAAVRSATIGMPIEPTASAPFCDGTWLLSHNGIVDRAILAPAVGAESTVDSAVLAAHIFERGLDALGETIVEVGARDPGARLNILAGNGSRLLATTWGDTLFALQRADGIVLASEPYDDDPSWRDIPDRHLVEVSGADLTLTPLEGP